MWDRNAPVNDIADTRLAWDKMDGLLPAIVQDRASGRVLMLGYMSPEALSATRESGFATFYSRSKGRLWQKGETSGNRLRVTAIHGDCDGDALLLLAEPAGPTCHLGLVSCFGDQAVEGPGWLADLQSVVRERAQSGDVASYTRQLLDGGPERIAQKIGEEGVEVALAAAAGDPRRCAEEVADLLYHLAVMMQVQGFDWVDVIAILKDRHRSSARSS